MGAGMNRYTDAPHLAQGELLTAINLRFRDPPKLSHRYGHNQYALTKFGGGGSGDNAFRLHSHKDSVLVASCDTLWAWSATAQKVKDCGHIGECLVRRKGLHSNVAVDPSDPAVAYGNGYFIYAWSTATNFINTHVIVVDEKNNTIVSSQTLSTAVMITPRLLMCGNTCWLLYADILGKDIRYAKMDVTSSSLAFGATAILPTSSTGDVGFTQSTFDACTISSTVFAVAYEDLSSGDVVVDTFNQTPTLQNTATINTSAAPFAIAIEGLSTDGIWVAWADAATGLNCTTYTPLLVLVSSDVLSATVTASSRAGIVRVSQTIRLVVWEEPAAGGVRTSTYWRTKTLAAGVGTTSAAIDIVPASKPFTYTTSNGTSQYVLCAFESDAQGTFYLMEIYRSGSTVGNGRWVATVARGIAKSTQYMGYLSSVATSTVNTTRVYIPAAIKKRFEFYGGEDETKIFARSRIDAITFDFDEDRLHNMVSWGDGVFICGGRPSWYDGEAVIEHGWAWSPQYMTVSVVNTASGALTNPGFIAYSVTYEDEDANGYIMRSAPWTEDINVTGAGNDTIRFLWAQDVGPTQRKATYRAFIYRTLADQVEPQFNIDTLGVGYSAALGGGGDATKADSVVEETEVCYTSGGVLDDAGTPPCEFACLHGERLWIGGLEDPETIWFSQPFIEREQPRFNEGLRVYIGSPVRAMASMDAQLIVWTDDGIFAVSGGGCPATGGADIGFEARRISTDVGCIDWRSVALTPIGLFFQSRKGIYLLDRGLNTTYIGAPIAAYLSGRAEIVAALAEEETPTVLFLINLTSPGATISVRLVYDYQVKAWTVDTLPFPAVDMRMAYDGIQGKRVPTLLENDYLWFESGSVTTDGIDANPIDTELSWGDIKLSGAVQGWERIRIAQILFDNAPQSASIIIDFSFDYSNSYTEAHTFTIAEQQAAGTRLQVDLVRQECQAVRARIRELNEGNGGVKYRGLVFEGGIMPGPKQLAAGAKK